MEDIIKIVKSVKERWFIDKIYQQKRSKIIKRWTSQRALGTLCVSLLGNLLTGNGVKQSKILNTRVKISGRRILKAGEGTIRAEEVTTRAGQVF